MKKFGTTYLLSACALVLIAASAMTSAVATQAPLNVGGLSDYQAATTNVTQTAVGSFPTVTGVTGSATTDYSLQINTNVILNPNTCIKYGYPHVEAPPHMLACFSKTQFIYSTDVDDDPSNGRQAGVFIRNWISLGDLQQLNFYGCPDGWTAAPAQFSSSCYGDSAVVSAPEVAISDIDSIKLTGTATAGGVDTVTLNVDGIAYSASQNDDLLYTSTYWRNTEFNIFGTGQNHPLVSFNTGTHLKVKLALNDGSTNTPTCSANGGNSDEQNNLTLGACTATGGANPHIDFSESR